MKKHIAHPVLWNLLAAVMLSVQVDAQHDCHALFSSHQLENLLTVDFTDLSTSPDTVVSWLWDFGDGSTSDEQNPAHTYNAPGTYQVCLAIIDDHGCGSHVCTHMIVHHLPAGECHAAFDAHQQDSGVPTIDFTDQSAGDGTIISWEWNFGDGHSSNEQNPSHTYAHAGVYLVCLAITDDHGCDNHVCTHVTVHQQPAGECHAAFTAHQVDSNQATIDFTDQSTGDGTIISWEWDFGDGHTSNGQNPSHTYAHAGVYLVCLVISDSHGCGNHLCTHVIIHQQPPGECHAAFDAHQPDPNLPTLDFTDQSDSDGDIISWEWDFGDGHTSNEQNPSHTYAHPGTYLICLTITDYSGCTSHVCHHVTLHHVPMDENNLQPVIATGNANFHSLSGIITNGIQLFPNPSFASVTLEYKLTDEAWVTLEVFDKFGNKEIEIINAHATRGAQLQTLDVAHLFPGFYLVKLTVSGEAFVQKLSILE